MKAQTEQSIRFYVSPQGDDRWSGSLPEANALGQDGPFGTLVRAQRAVRELLAKGPLTAPVRIELRGGRYELAETLTFTPADSGTAECPITWAAYAGEQPIVSGGRLISDWRVETVHGQTCWVADLPEVRSGEWFFTQLFANGERRFRPTLPSQGYYHFDRLVEGDRDTGFEWLNGPTRIHYRDEEIKPFHNLDDVKVMVYQFWFETHHRIKELDEANKIVHFHAKSLGSLIDEKGESARYIIENVFEGLDTPGEWYLDRVAGKLYYLPRLDVGRTHRTERPDNLEIIAPRLGTLLKLQGQEGARVAHLRFENISFQHAEWDTPRDFPGSIQASSDVPGAIVFDWADSCALYGCEVAHVAQYGIEVCHGSTGNTIAGTHIHDLGGGGVKVGHDAMDRVNETNPFPILPAADGRPMATRICDCTIHDGGHRFPSAIGVWIGNSGFNRVQHNEIYDLNYTGVSDGWTWGYRPTETVDNRVDYNHIHDINTREILSDNGGIYTLGIHPGGSLRGNLIHDVSCYGYGGWGIYPDEGSSEMIIEDNVVHHTKEAAFSVHYGRDLWVRNNLWALSRDAHCRPGKLETHRSALMERNVFYWREGVLSHALQWFPAHYTLRNNLFYNASGAVDAGLPFDLSEWQEQGQLEGTVVADPLFTAVDGGDLSLRSDSPALALGLKPSDTRKAGPRFAGQRPASYDEWLAAYPDKPKPILRTLLELSDPQLVSQGEATLKVTLANVGQIPASGRVTLVPRAGAVELTGATELTVDNLAPGQTQDLHLGLRIVGEHKFTWVDSIPEGPALVPARLLIRPDWAVERLGSVPTLGELPQALASAIPQSLEFGPRNVGTVRIAVAGNALALVAQVADLELVEGESLTDRSLIEVCTSAIDAEQRGWHHHNAAIGLMGLVPQIGDTPARAYWQGDSDESIDPVRAKMGTNYAQASDVKIATSPTADGYELCALIPLHYLKVDPQAPAFRFELVLNGVFVPGDKRQRSVLFHAMWPEVDNRTYGVVRVS